MRNSHHDTNESVVYYYWFSDDKWRRLVSAQILHVAQGFNQRKVTDSLTRKKS